MADRVAELLSEAGGARVPTVVVDSMQVYREIPTITNQRRRRPAELVGVASVNEEWTVARHRDLAIEEISASDSAPYAPAAVLDAGTGLYLNAILLEITLSPKVEPRLRELAQAEAAGAVNPRRAARARELELAGESAGGSVWEGELRYDLAGVYLRPQRTELDARIRARSHRIVERGIAEAETLLTMIESGASVNASVLDSIGVRELIQLARAEITEPEAIDRVAGRTRRLARRQMRWFDKLARTLQGRASLHVSESHAEIDMNSIHDILRV